jgi:protein TonB
LFGAPGRAVKAGFDAAVQIVYDDANTVSAETRGTIRIVQVFAALSEERIFYIPKSRREDIRRRALSLVLVTLIYGGLAVAVFYQRTPTVAAQPEEIPVEVVVEPPPPPPAPPPPEPKAKDSQPPKPPDIDLTPAHDAPKAGTAETDNGDKEKDAKPPPAPEAEDKSAEKLSGADAQAQAPKPEATPTPEPTPTSEPTPAPTATPEPTPTPVETPPPPLKASDSGDVPAPAASPAPQPANTAPPAPEKAQPPAGKAKNAPLFAALPDVEFGGAAMKTPVTGGAAHATYLSMVYGMIMPHVRKPTDARSMVGRGRGAVVFSIDGQGRLVDRWISEQSGSPELDKAVFDAIGVSGPFPPPPGRGTVQLRFTYDGG